MQVRTITALITPFTEKGEIDFDSLDQLIQFQIDQKTAGLVLCGSTGEGSLLTREEKLSIYHRAVEVGKGEIQIIANVGGCCTRKSVDLAKDAENLGVDGCIAVVPYYVKPTEEGCFVHFSEIAQVGLPLIVYHNPGRTGVKLSFEGLSRICKIPGVIGIKEASGDLELAENLIKEGAALYSGDDIYCERHLGLGAAGSISIAGNVVPDLWNEFIKSKKMDPTLRKLCEALVLETNPQCVKYAVALSGRCKPYCRLPLMEPTKEHQMKVRDCLEALVEISS